MGSSVPTAFASLLMNFKLAVCVEGAWWYWVRMSGAEVPSRNVRLLSPLEHDGQGCPTRPEVLERRRVWQSSNNDGESGEEFWSVALNVVKEKRRASGNTER